MCFEVSKTAPCADLLQDKTHMVAKKVFVTSEAFHYRIEQNVFFLNVSPKNGFPKLNWIPKPTKQLNFHPKKMC